MFRSYSLEDPELAGEIEQMQRRELPPGWDRDLPGFPADAKGLAGRDASGEAFNTERSLVSRRLGGSGAVEQNRAQVPRRRRFSGRNSGREEFAFRHPRTRDAGDRQRG
jgi:transketolase